MNKVNYKISCCQINTNSFEWNFSGGGMSYGRTDYFIQIHGDNKTLNSLEQKIEQGTEIKISRRLFRNLEEKGYIESSQINIISKEVGRERNDQFFIQKE